MIFKFLKHRKYKKLIRKNADFILLEFAEIADQTINKFQKENLIETPLQKEFLKFEITAFLFWMFQKTDVFSELWHKLLLDEIHNQYYDRLRKNGYKFEMRQLVANDFNTRYQTYNKIFNEDRGMVRIGAAFVRFLNERSESDINIEQMNIPLYLTDQVTRRFAEWKTILED